MTLKQVCTNCGCFGPPPEPPALSCCPERNTVNGAEVVAAFEELSALRARAALMEEALRPFAHFYKGPEHDLSISPDHMIVTTFADQKTGLPLAEIQMGDLRRARSALSGGEPT